MFRISLFIILTLMVLSNLAFTSNEPAYVKKLIAEEEKRIKQKLLEDIDEKETSPGSSEQGEPPREITVTDYSDNPGASKRSVKKKDYKSIIPKSNLIHYVIAVEKKLMKKIQLEKVYTILNAIYLDSAKVDFRRLCRKQTLRKIDKIIRRHLPIKEGVPLFPKGIGSKCPCLFNSELRSYLFIMVSEQHNIGLKLVKSSTTERMIVLFPKRPFSNIYYDSIIGRVLCTTDEEEADYIFLETRVAMVREHWLTVKRITKEPLE